MFPTWSYWLAAGGALLLALALSCFPRGRRALLLALPGLAFFALLGAAAWAGIVYGRATAGDAAEGPKVIYTCSMDPQIRQEGPGLCPKCGMQLEPMQARTAGPLTIEAQVRQNMGLRLLRAQPGKLTTTVRAFGELRWREDRQRDVTLKVDGYVTRLHADTVGMALRAGEPLFRLYAPDLMVAAAELQAALAGGNAGLIEAARRKLQWLDVPAPVIAQLEAADQPPAEFDWPCPIDGTLLERQVLAGAAARADERLLRIADLHSLWLDAQVPEHSLDLLAVGSTARVTFAALPDLTPEGAVTFVAPAIDPQTRTGTVRLEVANTDGRLRPGMFARLEFTREHSEEHLLLPASAVLDSGLRRLVWQHQGNGRFTPREVELGRHGDGGVVQILSGIAAGDEIVVNGHLLIDAESRLQDGINRLSPPSDAGLPRVSLDADTQPSIDALLEAYLALSAQLAADRHDPAAWQKLRDAVQLLHDQGPGELPRLAGPIVLALQAEANDIAAMRRAYLAASKPFLVLFERARPSARQGAVLRHMHCPMVEPEGGDWLQLEPVLRNPYYGAQMLECGDEVRQLPLHQESGK